MAISSEAVGNLEFSHVCREEDWVGGGPVAKS